MKKTIILLLTLCSSLLVNAQTFVTELPINHVSSGGSVFMRFIPKNLVFDNVPYLYGLIKNSTDNLDRSIVVYNEKIDLIATIKVNSFKEGTDYIIGNLSDYNSDYYNYDNFAVYSSYSRLYISQTFFNDDKNFELIYSLYDKANSSIEETDYDGDGIIDNKFVSGSRIGFIVLSDDGTEVFKFKVNDGERLGYIEFFTLGDVNYFKIEKYKKDTDEELFSFYRIDKSTSSIKLVKETKFKVNPTIADRSDVITVELDDNHQVREMSVVNAAGQVVKRVPVAPGQKYVSFSAQGMSQGLNIINAPEKGENNTQKIMVK